MNGRRDEDAVRRLRDGLFSEALLLADEARGYFEARAETEVEALDPVARVRFSCESLKVTTRLMHALAWLMMRRAIDAGEIGPDEVDAPERRLGEAPVTQAGDLAVFPAQARALVEASIDLHRRVALLDAACEPGGSPVRALQERLRDRLL